MANQMPLTTEAACSVDNLPQCRGEQIYWGKILLIGTNGQQKD